MEHLIWYNGFENMNQIILGTTKHSDLLYQIHIDSNSFLRCKKIIQAMLLSQHQVSSVPFVGPIPSTGAATIAAKGGGMQYHQSCKQPYQQQQTPTAKSCARSCAVTVTRTHPKDYTNPHYAQQQARSAFPRSTTHKLQPTESPPAVYAKVPTDPRTSDINARSRLGLSNEVTCPASAGSDYFICFEFK